MNRDKVKMDEILSHIKRVESLTQKLAKKLMHQNKPFALKLIQLGRTHDLSKFSAFEFENLNHYPETDKEDFKKALAQHHELNGHHPEYYASIHNMPDEYVAEMVCDCLARAQEFGTNIETFFSRTATKKYDFKMKDPIGQKIKYYLSLLLDTRFKKIN